MRYEEKGGYPDSLLEDAYNKEIAILNKTITHQKENMTKLQKGLNHIIDNRDNKIKKLKEKMVNKIYVVTMYRWGDRESHSYVHGVYTDKDLAIEHARREQGYRGGNKYFPEVLEYSPNTPLNEDDVDYKAIIGLKGNK